MRRVQASRIDRRHFAKVASAGLATFHILPRRLLGGPNHVPPSETIHIALVGAGGRGLENARELMRFDDAKIVAVADPAESWDMSAFYYRGQAGRKPTIAEIEKHYGAASQGFRCAEYEDFRVLFEQESGIDAVLCATPDHLHGLVSASALRAGFHAYCEKPLTHNVREARLLAELTRETGLATQMGNQGHSTDGIRATCELLWAGAVGQVREAHAWVPATRWNPGLKGRPEGSRPVPRGLNWDLWIGPRRPVPFHEAYAPVTWRDFWEFGCGALGDFGCHDIDAACWALNLKEPESIEVHPAGYADEWIAPYGEIGYFSFAAKGEQQPVRLYWYSGGLLPERPAELPLDVKLPARGGMFVGDQGVLLTGGLGGGAQIFPESRRADFQQVAPSIPRSKGHHRDWLDAIKGGPPASSNFEYGARLTEITLLGVASLRTRQRILWDAPSMSAPGIPDEIFRGTYRAEWAIG